MSAHRDRSKIADHIAAARAALDTRGADSQTITITALDDLADTGTHVTSRYSETFWLPVIGPSALWLLRHAAIHTAHGPYVVDIDDLSRSLGLGNTNRGRHAPICRTLDRLVSFRCATGGWSEGVWRLRTHLPPLHGRQVARLPEALRVAHTELLAVAS